MNDLAVCVWPIAKLIPYARNSRKIPDRAVDKVAVSIKEFGWRVPIVVDKDGVIICGHTRLLAARKLGLQQVPVHVADNLTPAQVRAYRLMDNRSHEETDWDLELLGQELEELRGLDFDLELTGFDGREIDDLLLDDADDDRANAVPLVPEIPVSRAGDLWLCGPHRVLCGDSTQVDAVERLMGGEKASCMWTDPPYGVDYTGKTKQALKIEGDSSRSLRALLDEAFSSATVVLADGSPVYVAHPAGALSVTFGHAFLGAGWRLHQTLVWDKQTIVLGHSDYHYSHEPIFYGYTPGEGRCGRGGKNWYGDNSQRSVLAFPKPSRSEDHPTMKPVGLVEHCLSNSSKRGDVVLDLFGGSGSTLIACEKSGRSARLMELAPQYVDVIVDRWQNFTGQQATLGAGGQTFEAAKYARLGVAA